MSICFYFHIPNGDFMHLRLHRVYCGFSRHCKKCLQHPQSFAMSTLANYVLWISLTNCCATETLCCMWYDLCDIKLGVSSWTKLHFREMWLRVCFGRDGGIRSLKYHVSGIYWDLEHNSTDCSEKILTCVPVTVMNETWTAMFWHGNYIFPLFTLALGHIIVIICL